MTFWTTCPHRVQRKIFKHTSRDSTTGDVKASVICSVSARSRHFVNVDVIFLTSVCDSFCVSTFSLCQGGRSFCHELYEQSTVVFCRSGRDACFTFVCILCADHVSGILGFFGRNSTVLSSPFLVCIANIVEEYVLLSALLHDQSCLQSSPCFQHQFVWLPFSRTLVCKGGCSFHVHGSTRVVSSSLSYVAVSRARQNNWDKPLLDVIIIDLIVSATITERS